MIFLIKDLEELRRVLSVHPLTDFAGRYGTGLCFLKWRSALSKHDNWRTKPPTLFETSQNGNEPQFSANAPAAKRTLQLGTYGTHCQLNSM